MYLTLWMYLMPLICTHKNSSNGKFGYVYFTIINFKMIMYPKALLHLVSLLFFNWKCGYRSYLENTLQNLGWLVVMVNRTHPPNTYTCARTRAHAHYTQCSTKYLLYFAKNYTSNEFTNDAKSLHPPIPTDRNTFSKHKAYIHNFLLQDKISINHNGNLVI